MMIGVTVTERRKEEERRDNQRVCWVGESPNQLSSSSAQCTQNSSAALVSLQTANPLLSLPPLLRPTLPHTPQAMPPYFPPFFC